MSEIGESIDRHCSKSEYAGASGGRGGFWRFDSGHELQKSIDEQRVIKRCRTQASAVEDDNPLCKIYAIPVEGKVIRKFSFLELCYVLFERIVALVFLLLTLPVMLLEWIIVRLDSPGPALFVQSRVTMSRPRLGSELAGKDYLQAVDGEFEPDKYYYEPTLFRFIKFRSMYIDAKQRFPEWYDYNYSRKEFLDKQFKVSDDPRVTRVGRLIRRLTIDEFPNFWCVLVGSMRLVGPRPELPGLLQCYSPELMKKFTVKPGITGLAQINGRGDLGFRSTIGYDLQYIRERTVWLDLLIIVKTFWLVLTRRGAF